MEVSRGGRFRRTEPATESDRRRRGDRSDSRRRPSCPRSAGQHRVGRRKVIRRWEFVLSLFSKNPTWCGD